MYGITYNNKYSCDLGLKVLERNISTPAKKKVIEEIPFSNVVYDFSALYGAQIFEQRILEYTFFIDELLKDNLEITRVIVENWLYSNDKKTKLNDDVIPGYHFLAECTSIDFEDVKTYGRIKATFEAYPFRVKNEKEGEIIWDDFCFLSDTLQNTSFEVENFKEINLINKSIIALVPSIVADSKFEIHKSNEKYLIKPGKSQSSNFKLSPGENKLILVGKGNISFDYKIEVI